MICYVNNNLNILNVFATLWTTENVAHYYKLILNIFLEYVYVYNN